ncbi:hypothetical protein C1J03_02570 [Sulfitobacter sp. SK012]|uniref:3-hydroxyacyl-CoA dehydrogenase family protein n=1 Tax=Sulfitobacter sp. SK012 TaxID=1389005 RepID=UPI000E0AB758|nr:3-hydroxyacyl-CoA dehydrogenase family protein [Sulfitobacter sp. SK012]AXI45012.1 hypothetical protein C1J03_02570 [Sulfitobacter sp. SK012]
MLGDDRAAIKSVLVQVTNSELSGFGKRCAQAGLSVTFTAEDTFEAERLRHMFRALPDVDVVLDQTVLQAPDVVISLQRPPWPDALWLCPSPPSQAPTGAIPIHFHDDLAEAAFDCASGADVALAKGFFDQLGFAVVVCANGADRFAGLALLDAAVALGDRLLLMGALPWELDAALKVAGYATGLFAAQDIAGLTGGYARRTAAGASPLLVTDRMVREGRHGRAVGVGWYRYPGGGGAVIDPLIEDMIVEEAYFAKLRRGVLLDKDAVHYLTLGLACAGAGLIADGTASSGADVDALCAALAGLPPQGCMAVIAGIPIKEVERTLDVFATDDLALWGHDSLLRYLRG